MKIEEVQGQLEYIAHSKKTHAYSPAVVKILDLFINYVQDAEQASQQGKAAVWSSTYAWDWWQVPLLYACDIIPVSYSEMSRASDRDVVSIAENYYQFPVETCSMVKATVGEFYLRKDVTSIRRIFGNATICEPYNLAWEVLKNEGYEVHTNEAVYRGPSVKGKRLEQLVQFFSEQMYDAAEWLTGSRTIDEDKLRIELQRKNRIMEKMRIILQLREKRPFYIRSLATIVLLNIGLNNYFGKPEEFEAAADLLITEMQDTPINEEDLKKVIPLVWAGGTGQEFGVYEVIDQAGGALLGFRNAPFKLCREDIPPVEALVRAVFDNQSAGAGVYARQVIEQEIDRLNATGLILYGHIGCSYSGIEREIWRKYFQEKGVSCITLEGAFEIGPPSGQVITRIKAFIEMLA